MTHCLHCRCMTSTLQEGPAGTTLRICDGCDRVLPDAPDPKPLTRADVERDWAIPAPTPPAVYVCGYCGSSLNAGEARDIVADGSYLAACVDMAACVASLDDAA
jgi:hypothetical protein